MVIIVRSALQSNKINKGKVTKLLHFGFYNLLVNVGIRKPTYFRWRSTLNFAVAVRLCMWKNNYPEVWNVCFFS